MSQLSLERDPMIVLTHTQNNVREVVNLSATVNIALYSVTVQLTNNIREVWKCHIKTTFFGFVIDFISKCDSFLLAFAVCVLTGFGRWG